MLWFYHPRIKPVLQQIRFPVAAESGEFYVLQLVYMMLVLLVYMMLVLLAHGKRVLKQMTQLQSMA